MKKLNSKIEIPKEIRCEKGSDCYNSFTNNGKDEPPKTVWLHDGRGNKVEVPFYVD